MWERPDIQYSYQPALDEENKGKSSNSIFYVNVQLKNIDKHIQVTKREVAKTQIFSKRLCINFLNRKIYAY